MLGGGHISCHCGVVRGYLLVTCYLLWSSGLYSPTRLLALPRPLAGGQGHLVNGLR